MNENSGVGRLFSPILDGDDHAIHRNSDPVAMPKLMTTPPVAVDLPHLLKSVVLVLNYLLKQ